jgi:8-oxo-dGTP pyrophosphatase MutT (NUDIX family)
VDAHLALIVPSDGARLHLVEQYRLPIDARSWELPSGDVDPSDADVAAAASRELREETGLVAHSLIRLGTLDVMPSTVDQRCAVFLATDLTEGPTDRDPGERDMRSSWFTRAEVERMIADGTIRDSKTLAAFALFALHDR